MAPARMTCLEVLILQFGLGTVAALHVQPAKELGRYTHCAFNITETDLHMDVRPLPLAKGCAERMRVSDLARGIVTVACVGDSITQGSHVSNLSSYPGQLFQKLHGEYNVINLGVSGSTMQVGRNRSYWRTPQFEALLEGQPDIILLQLGTNDAKTFNWDPLSYRQSFIEMVRKFQSLPSRPIIVPMIPPAVTRAAGDEIRHSINQTVVNTELPPVIRAVSQELQLPTPVDMQEAIDEAGKGLMLDDVHPTARGYSRMIKPLVHLVRRMAYAKRYGLPP